MKTWEDRVNEVIAKLCYQSWYEVNHNKQGKRYKKHRPYTVPQTAVDLVNCLKTNDEEQAKAIMLYRHDAKLD